VINNKELNARYFNGKNAIPELGIAFFTQSTLTLKTESQSYKYSIDSFHQVELIPIGIKCTLLADELQESPTIELLCDHAEAKEIEKLWILHKKGENLFQSIALYFRNLKPKSLITMGVFFIAVTGSIFYFSLQKLYIFFPASIDEKLGKNFDENIQKSFPICDSKEVERFFSSAIKELVPNKSNYNYSVKVINLKEENAISLAGGRIYFFSGLLQSSENQEEILGVLAHEIAHVEKRHHLRSIIKAIGTSFAISVLVGPGLGDFQTIETLTELGSTIAVLKYSRDFETEADLYSYELLQKSNRSVEGLLLFLKRMSQYENMPIEGQKAVTNPSKDLSSKIKDNIIDLLSSHPPTEERIKSMENFLINRKKGNVKSIVSNSEWERIKSACHTK
jgi:Zn-dependent protease with chaperone function